MIEHDMNNDLERLAGEYARRRERSKVLDTYSIYNPGEVFAIQRRQREIIRILRKEGFLPLYGKCILEVGCGRGGVLREFLSFGAEPGMLHGIELLPWRCVEGMTSSPKLPIVCGDGRHLPYPPEIFDVVLQFTMFSSILDDAIKRAIAKEMLRVLKPSGFVLWYDFWLNPKNPHAKGIRAGEIKNLYPECRISLRRIELAPPIARRLAKVSWIACEILENMKIFNSFYLATITPVPSS